jgi:membrane protease YdiL (CAAX protease family)
MGEELGWRGTALPRLLTRWNALISSIILGVLWGLYHLPSFLLSGLPLKNAPLIPFMLGALAITILVTWTFNHTNGSLIPVFLYHFSFNLILNVTGIFSNPTLLGFYAVITLVTSIIVVVLERIPSVQPANPLTEWSGREE